MLGLFLFLIPIFCTASVIGTYFGGTDIDYKSRIAVDSAGNVYICGATFSIDIPVTEGVYQPNVSTVYELFVAKLDPTLTNLIYCTYLGGYSGEGCTDLKVDNEGNLYVAGFSGAGFPTTPNAMVTTASGFDGFVAKINPTGTALVYSTYIGGGTIVAMDLDTAGCVYLTGYPSSTSFPVSVNAKDTVYNNVFVMKLNKEGSGIEYSTYLGGSMTERPHGIKVDTEGNAFVTGGTVSDDFPVTPGVLGTMNAGGVDTYLVKVNPTGTDWVFSTYLNMTTDDEGYRIDFDTTGNIFIAGAYGKSTSYNFIPEAISLMGGNLDLFIKKINPNATKVLYTIETGGSYHDLPQGLLVTPEGRVSVVGCSLSFDYPTTSGAPCPTVSANGDGFFTQFSPEGLIEMSTYLDTRGSGNFYGIGKDFQGNIYTVGDAYYDNPLVTEGCYQPNRVNIDAVILKISPSIVPVELSGFLAE